MHGYARGAMAAVQYGGRMGSRAGGWQAGVVAAVALAHAAGLWVLLGTTLRPAASAAAPQVAMVMVLSEAAAQAVPQLQPPQPLLPPPAPRRAEPQAAPKQQARPAPRRQAAPTPAPAAAAVAVDEPVPAALPQPHSVLASAAGSAAEPAAAAEGAAEGAAAAPAAKAVAMPAVLRRIETVDYLRAPVLEYPSASRRFGEQGRVVLRVLVGPDGQAERVELVEGTAFRRLNDAAIEAARRALYKPHTENGVPQPAWALVALSFQLRR